jgi:hypothetical protein
VGERREYRTPERLTEKQAKSLRILRDNDIAYPAQFAKLAWPDADGWRRGRKCGNNGIHRGGGMYVAAGCHLGILARLGLITARYRHHGLDTSARAFRLTEDGVRLLAAYEAAQAHAGDS